MNENLLKEIGQLYVDRQLVDKADEYITQNNLENML